MEDVQVELEDGEIYTLTLKDGLMPIFQTEAEYDAWANTSEGKAAIAQEAAEIEMHLREEALMEEALGRKLRPNESVQGSVLREDLEPGPITSAQRVQWAVDNERLIAAGKRGHFKPVRLAGFDAGFDPEEVLL